MAFELQHILVATRFTPTVHTAGGDGFCTVRVEGDLPVLWPGRLETGMNASFRHRVRRDPDPRPGGDAPGVQPQDGPFETRTHTIALRLALYRPDGHEFKRDVITLADLRAFRDLRGSPQGSWRYKLSGESQHFGLDQGDLIFEARGSLSIRVRETVRSESAGPLIANASLDGSRQSFELDLFRVGTLVAEVSNVTDAEWRGTLSLVDPAGAVLKSTSRRILSFPVELTTLAKSRDAAGAVRRWRLEVAPQGGVVVGSGSGPKLSATVVGSGRITTAALHSRIEFMLGPRGRFIKIYGENAGGEALARLVITDIAAAESLDMHRVLDKALARVAQDPPAEASDLQANVVYTLARGSEDLKLGTRLDVSSLQVGTIDLSVGPAVRLGAAVPAVRLKVAVSGDVKVKLGPAAIASARVRDGSFEMEVGIVLTADGTPQLVSWLPGDPFDIDLHWGVVLGAGAIAGPLIAFGAAAFTEYLENVLNDRVAAGARDLFSDPALAPRILMTIFGAHLNYRAIRIEGGTIVFDHIAPLEPDPRPRAGYAGAIGRTMIELTPGRPQFVPPLLPDTWAAGNLAKIDHIVVVMMENRSYDHVLGYRAQGEAPDGADGLTEATIAAIQAANGAQYRVRKLGEAGFAKNALGKMTRIPKSVGHKLDDVREQLAGQAQRADGGQINDPKGFVDNFRPRLRPDPMTGVDPTGVEPDDVLGYYEASDLPFSAYLAEHYGYCDRYYGSHPGPTLPNRMYSLAGDVQYDRFGVPILDNNHGDNILLSRAATIYDLLTRKGVSWRVYESGPSVTMLRMFARYATNTTDIVPFERLAADVAAGNLPAFTFVEPAMHHHPQDDDHPDADMYRGQIFLKRVYDALRSNPAVWQKTLLLITYDEHGGLYDHVVPPIADHLSAGSPGKIDPVGSRLGAGELGRAGHRVAASRGSERSVALADAPAAGDEADAGAALRLPSRRRPGDGDTDPGDPGDPDPGGGGGPHPGTDEDPLPPPPRDPVKIPYGVRVPTFVVSPWVKPGKGPSLILDHCSILKTVLARFGGGSKPFLSDRVHASQSFEAFLTEPQPRVNVPAPPELGTLPIDARRLTSDASQIITPPLSRKRMREGEADFHDVSGHLARMLGR